MAVNQNDADDKQALGPSVVLGLVGAVVVLLLLGAGIWGVGKIISKIRESRDEATEEEVAEEDSSTDSEQGEETEEGKVSEEGDEGEVDTEQESQESSEEDSLADSEQDSEEVNGVASVREWIATDYREGDITGDKYTVLWGDTLWEISEARYGSGFEWVKIRDANLDDVGFLPNGSRALIVPGQVLNLPE
ncbi:LysM peptidoglycan-binding domain-containing protein [Patescibacteria group bacterium]